MKRADTIIVGGGQAGLAMSRCLTSRDIDHVVLERGRVAERWRRERWNSLRLLTPNWQSRLPGYRYTGPDPDGFMTMPEVTEYLERYARSFAAPVQGETTVVAVEQRDRGFDVTTDQGTWHGSNVVVATGYCDLPLVPDVARDLSRDVLQIVPGDYRCPDRLPDGGVLVVGASSSGIQLADEIHASGRAVTLAVGRHMRLPRRYRGRDILWWLDAMGLFDERVDEVYDADISRNQPSLQLVGRPDHATLDLGRLLDRGVRLVGRVTGASNRTVHLCDDLVSYMAAADIKLASVLSRIDRYIEQTSSASAVEDAEPFRPLCWPPQPPAPERLDLAALGIRTVVWATGFRRSYPWLKVPVLDEHDEIRHRGGVTPVPGFYVVGMQFLRRRKSAFIDGVGDDAEALAAHIEARLAAGVRRARLSGMRRRSRATTGGNLEGRPLP
jgi:putative flavoprotein involved in K+ transport